MDNANENGFLNEVPVDSENLLVVLKRKIEPQMDPDEH